MSALPPAIAAEIAAAGRSQLEFDDNLLLPALYVHRNLVGAWRIARGKK